MGKQAEPPDTLVFVAGLSLLELRAEVEAVAVARLYMGDVRDIWRKLEFFGHSDVEDWR